MTDQVDGLGLIARAGRRLQKPQENRIAPATSGERINASPPSSSDQVWKPVLPAASTGPLARQERLLDASPGEPTPIKLSFSELRRSRILTPDNLRSNLGFEFRSIKRKLLNSANNEGVRTNLVMVSSARPSEGKTFTSVNLAISLAAERDFRVLLIDADVVRPKVTTFFEPVCREGLTDLLKGECGNIANISHRCSDLPNLEVVFAGDADDHSPELLGSRRMSEICKQLSERYAGGIIVIDTPPVLASAETASLAGFMHQIIMVVASGQTTRTQLQAALEQVSVCRNISLLLNKAPEWNRILGDTYYYYYGYGGDRTEANERH